MFKCSICDKEFETKGALGGHVASVHSEKLKETVKTKKEEREYLEVRTCKKCKNEFNIRKNLENKFCSRKCANSRIHNEKTKEKISKSLTKSIAKLQKINCKECTEELSVKNKTGYCRKCSAKYRIYSEETRRKLSLCGRKGGRASVLMQQRRSKNEIIFANLCIDYFKEVKCNEKLFNGWDADVIIEDIRIAVLWNGKWHYEKITEKHSVLQVQNRDKIKLKEIENCGYRSYIIKDLGDRKRSENESFVKSEFEKFLKHCGLV